MTLHPHITFVTVTDNQAKLTKLLQCVQQCFIKGHSVLIAVPSVQVAQYIDQLLWRMPKESFLPHVISDSGKVVDEKVVISMMAQNINKANVLVNLNPEISPIFGEFEFVWELLDKSDSVKEGLSRQRQVAYQEAGCKIKVT